MNGYVGDRDTLARLMIDVAEYWLRTMTAADFARWLESMQRLGETKAAPWFPFDGVNPQSHPLSVWMLHSSFASMLYPAFVQADMALAVETLYDDAPIGGRFTACRVYVSHTTERGAHRWLGQRTFRMFEPWFDVFCYHASKLAKPVGFGANGSLYDAGDALRWLEHALRRSQAGPREVAFILTRLPFPKE